MFVANALTLYQTTQLLDLTNFKAFADEEINVAEKLKVVNGWVENILRKGENAGYQHFSFSHNIFLLRVVKTRDCVVKD